MTNITIGQESLIEREPLISRWLRSYDRNLLIAILVVFVIGVVLSFSATPILAERLNRDPFTFAYRHIFFGILSLGVMFFLSFFSPIIVRRFGLILFPVAFLCMALLPLFGTDFGKGAVRWFSLGFISVQPTEFLKPAFIIVCGWLIAGSMEPLGPRGKTVSFFLTVLVVGMLVIQPDFGHSAIIIALWGAMFFVANGSIGLLILVGGISLLGGVLAYMNSEHFARRINDYISVLIGDNSLIQINSSLETIREGGIFGRGAAQGIKKWNLPEAHTDFIIAVAAEEYGLILVLIIIGLFTYILRRTVKLAGRSRSPFIQITAIGLASTVSVQAFVHIAACINLMPVKGMTLPFISYGGSSMIATSISLGLLLALLRHADEDHAYEDKLRQDSMKYA